MRKGIDGPPSLRSASPRLASYGSGGSTLYAAGYIKQAIHSYIEESQGVITEPLPMLAARLVELGLSSEVKP